MPSAPITTKRITTSVTTARAASAARGLLAAAHHPVVVRAPRDIGAGSGHATTPPGLLLLQRDDEDFLDATLDDLRSADGRTRLAARQAAARNAVGTLKLYQPIQRQFHLALIEVHCDTPGRPRLDPARIAAAGLVLRRLDAQGRPHGWMRRDGRVLGWLPVARLGDADSDPLASARPLPGRTGVADLDRSLAAWWRQQPDQRLDELVIPLHVAPPEVCRDADRTLCYGLIGTVSSERAEQAADTAPGPDIDFGPRSAAFRHHLVQALRGEAMPLPHPGETLRADWLDSTNASTDLTLMRFVRLLRQLSGEFDAFGAAPEALALRRVLAGITLAVPAQGDTPASTTDAATFLAAAERRLVQRLDTDNVNGAPRMPAAWPALPADQAGALLDALHAALQARTRAQALPAGRFDDPDAHYVLRPFVRLKPEGACPGRLVWGRQGEPFVIAPWFESGGAAPTRIQLPDPGDRSQLAAMRPNVSFVVPAALQKLLSAEGSDLLEGRGGNGGGGLTWLCSFSLPILTLCAFIVLNIFLSLFNLVFGWLPMIKICLPWPKVAPKPAPEE